MAYTEKTLQCSDCGKSFPFTVEEQEFFANKGFTNEPKRCPTCRSNRKSERNGDGYGTRNSVQMHSVTCARCGKQTEVPFQPRGDRPVYCKDCYNKNR